MLTRAFAGLGMARHFGRLRRRRRAWQQADFLDCLVDADLPLIRGLPVPLRAKPVEALAVLAVLAQDYRHYGRGWINRRQLRARAERAMAELEALRAEMAEEYQHEPRW